MITARLTKLLHGMTAQQCQLPCCVWRTFNTS